MATSNPQFVGWTALAGGAVGVVSFISLLLLFVIGEPFGTLNDLLSIPIALLMTPLVVALYRLHAAEYGVLSLLAMAAGLGGFLATAVGCGLLVLGRISFEQSLLAGIGGFGLIGLWLLINAALGLAAHTLPRGVAWFGLLLAVTPTLALVAVLRAGNVATVLFSLSGQSTGATAVSPLVYAFVALGAISYAGLPLWFILMARLILSGRWSPAVAAAAV
jgi:hypothetical protein